MLINRIYESEIRRIAAIAHVTTKDPFTLYKELNNLTSEDTRIKRLFEHYLSETLQNRGEIVSRAKTILAHFDNEREGPEESIYQVRNLIVHRYRDLAKVDSDYKMLSNFNLEFEKAIVEMLSFYIEPDNLYPNMPIEWLLYKLQFENK